MQRQIARKQFGDFGQYRRQLRCWDTDAVQVSPGPLTIRYDCFDTCDLVVTRLRFDQNAIARTAGKSEWHALAVDLSPRRWCGIDVPAGSFRSIAPMRETHVVNDEPWDSLNVVVRTETLATWDVPLAGLVDRNPRPENCVFGADRQAAARFSAWLESLFATSTLASEPGEAALWEAAIRDQLRRHLLDVLGHRATPRPVSAMHRVARYDLAMAALRLIQRETERRITVNDLACELGVSTRAVDYAFSSVIGMSPSRYILADRLNRARHDLRKGEAVTYAAFDHQFGNLSRFAYQYSRLFGERPSDTLRAARAAFQEA